MRGGRRGRAGLAAGLAAVLTVVVPAAAATNLIANGTFEGSGAGSLKGWGASSGTLSLTTGAGGGHAAQLTASSGAAQTYAYTSTRPVTSTVAGTAYQLDAQVESGLAGQTVCLQLRELKGTSTTLVGSAQSCISPTATWASFPTVAYTVQGSGNSLTVQIKEKPAVAGATYAMDNVSLSAGAAAPDTEPPSVPQGVTATALGPTAVTVAWSPSSDNVGVTGYDVLRDGTRVATVGGSATSWTDTTVQPSTGYTYTVDAFDAAGNHSVESAAAGVTTPASSGGTGAPIVLIMMENKPASAIVGSPYAPYIQSMIHSGTLLSNVLGVAGSYHNYLANTSGLTDTVSASDNIFHQLQAAGVAWGEYEESMPSDCYKGADVGAYKHGHNPAVYYNDITSSAAACANVVTLAAFDPTQLRGFSYVVPNLAHDMHDGTTTADQIAAGDAWLSANVPAMLSAGAEVLLTWDEGTTTNEHVAAILVGAGVSAGVVDTTAYTQPSLLAGLELRFGFPRLNAAATATPAPIP